MATPCTGTIIFGRLEQRGEKILTKQKQRLESIIRVFLKLFATVLQFAYYQ